MAPQFIYVMKALRKVVPPSRIILDDIWLSFYPGAKIGVLGPNGAGKSSLLRIMAGVDTEFQGEAWAHKGTRIGYLSQEPELDESLDVRGNVELAVKAQRDALNEYNDISMKFAEPDADFDKLMDRQAKLQEYIDQHDLWNLDNKVEVAMDALRLPPGDSAVTNLSGGEKRRVALCRVLLSEPDMLLLDEPTNHLDVTTRRKLLEALESYDGTLLCASHDPAILERIATRVYRVEGGECVELEEYRRERPAVR
jgi:energy-dependent translational throttle protein EttA